jgi:hypothetical protein
MYEGVEPNVLFQENAGRIITRDWLTLDQNEQLRRYHAGENVVAS